MNQAAFPETEPASFPGQQVREIFRADPNRVRAWLNAILAETRTASSLPWGGQRLRLYRAIFPYMSLWLPEAEAAQFRLEFESEIAKLEATAA